VAAADVNGDGRDDLVFANTGSNNVLVYLRRDDGTFADAPLSFFAGTSPADVRVAQLNDDNGDGAIDGADLADLVVANQGSNDVSVLFGTRGRDVNGDGAVGDADLFRVGPRLDAGDGPTAVMVKEVTGDGVPDVLAASGQNGTVTMIPGIGAGGVGTGFFADAAAQTVSLAPGPILAPVADPTSPTGELIVAPRDGGPVLVVNPVTGDSRVLFTPPPGVVPVAVDATAFRAPAGGATGGFAAPTALQVVTGNADGMVSVFRAGAGGVFGEFTRVDTGLNTISDVRVVPSAGGGFDVYVSGTDDNGLPSALVLSFAADAGADDPSAPIAPLSADGEPVVADALIGTELLPDGGGSGAGGGAGGSGGNGFGDGVGFDLVATLVTGIPVGPSASGGPEDGGGVESVNPLDAAPTAAADLGLTGEELVAFVDGGLAAAGFFFGDEDEDSEADARFGAGLVPFLLGVKRSLEAAARPDGETPAPSPGGAFGAVPPADPAPQSGQPGAVNRPDVETPAAEARPSEPAVASPAASPAAPEPESRPDVVPEAGALNPVPERPVADGVWSAGEVEDAADSAETLLSWARVVGGLALALARRPQAEAVIARRPSPLRPVDRCAL
jgi:hypothetical protein